MRDIRKASLLTIAAVALSALGFVADPARAAAPTLRLGYGPAAEEPLWLVIAKPQMWPNHGNSYSLDATRFVSSDKRAQAFEADAIDLASGSANGAIFAAADGVTAKIIASFSRESTRGFSTSFYAKASSPIKTVADLKGKTIAINGFSTSGQLWLDAALEKAGLKESDVTIVPIPFPAMQESLDSGKVDVAELPQPFAAMAEKAMPVRKIFDAKYGIPFDEELIVLTGKDAFLKKNADAVRGLLADVKAATKFYLEKPHEARQMLIDAKMVRVTPDVYLDMKDYYRDPDLRPDADSLEKMQQFQIKAGFQKKSADVKALVDLSYLPN